MGVNIMSSRVQGRWQMFHAGCGVPMVASDEISAQRALWPTLAVPWWDLRSAEETAWKLMEDRPFYEQAVEHAQKTVDWFGPEEQKRRLMDAIAGNLPMVDKKTGEQVGVMKPVVLEDLTVEQLREIGKSMGVDTRHQLRKAELIEALKEKMGGKNETTNKK